MTHTTQQISFNETLNEYSFATRRAFIRLDSESQIKVAKMYYRHKRACDSLGIGVDPYFIMDAIIECRNAQKRIEA